MRTGQSIRRICALTTIATLGLTVFGGAVAQVRSGDKLPEALTDIKPATGACRRDDIPQSGVGATSGPDIAADLTCAMNVDELFSLLNRSNVALIDLRASADYHAYHIGGALNLGLMELQSKPYWRNKTVVLVGSGKAEGELYRACSRLKQSGYSQVRVLRGGMREWLAYSLPIEGRAPAASQLARLTPAEFWLESRNSDNVVLLGPEQRTMQSDIPFAVTLPETTGEALRFMLERRRKQTKNAPMATVVLATESTVSDGQIQLFQKAIGPVPLLVYVGTREALTRQMAQQKTMWAAQARGPKQPSCGL